MFPYRASGLFALGLLVSQAGLARPASAASLQAKVDISSQKMEVFVDGKKRYSWSISTGKEGWRTPTGRFTPHKTYKSVYSEQFKMNLPHLVAITSNIGIHGTHAVGKLGRPASHGCIRLAPGNAATFYRLVNEHGLWNTDVQIQH